MIGCQVGDDRREGNRGALMLKQAQEDMLHERVYGDDQMRAVGLQDLAQLVAADQIDQAQGDRERALVFENGPEQLPEPEDAGNDRAVQAGHLIDGPGGVVGPQIDDLHLKPVGIAGGEGGLQSLGAGAVAAPGIAHQNQNSAGIHVKGKLWMAPHDGPWGKVSCDTGRESVLWGQG